MPSRRDGALAAFRETSEIDVLIVGGGVHGAGIFRDLALNGVKCALVERDDFAAGASGASTRMAHGGIRYLEHGHFRLVREAVLERDRLLRNAPHMVTPIQLLIPARGLWRGLLGAPFRLLGWGRRRSAPGLILLAIGLALYDRLGRRSRTLPRWGAAFGARARALAPGIARSFDGVGWIWDGRIRHPERLVVELIEDGTAAGPAGIALNHCALVGRDGATIVLRDGLGGETFHLKPRVVIDAAGAWADHVHRLLGLETATVTASQGTHLFLDNERLRTALADRLLYFADGRGRMCILYAMDGRVLLGTTDLPIDDADDAATSQAEIDYLLDAARGLFPGIAIDVDQIRFRTCGVRALQKTDGADIGAASRDYAVIVHGRADGLPFEILTLAGGKWTSFRAASETVADAALARLERRRQISTAAMPIGGGRDFPSDPAARRRWVVARAAETGASEKRVSVLLDRYGTRAAAIAAFCAATPDRFLAGAPGYTENEIRFLIRHEMGATPGDIVLRRTQLAFDGANLGEVAASVAALIDQESEKSPSPGGVEAFMAELSEKHGVGAARRATAPAEV